MVLFCLDQVCRRDSGSVAGAFITMRCCNSCWQTLGCLPHPISGLDERGAAWVAAEVAQQIVSVLHGDLLHDPATRLLPAPL